MARDFSSRSGASQGAVRAGPHPGGRIRERAVRRGMTPSLEGPPLLNGATAASTSLSRSAGAQRHTQVLRMVVATAPVLAGTPVGGVQAQEARAPHPRASRGVAPRPTPGSCPFQCPHGLRLRSLTTRSALSAQHRPSPAALSRSRRGWSWGPRPSPSQRVGAGCFMTRVAAVSPPEGERRHLCTRPRARLLPAPPPCPARP